MATQDDPASSAAVPLLRAAVKGMCPRCSAPALFAGPVRFAPSCRPCGLDYGQFNVGDGPAAFLTLEYRNRAREGRIADKTGS
ncbi:hypothetical protein V475_16645 [Sphingobium baderi LL03]|uniref:DUF983 domain-containing protein n=1 Tax=Sphingobium baderi LL03 TaxID=1114964 RepID=T0GL27_9SPHN|nr:DUF983 domain-containing protein [Sphingobium baderi]EQB01382.1 hypothetical protein L485_10935 [Sphingobium baderi LL03]KMS60868.1 hypothetical protein V475_16645 [Sphingobium baderi LL03]